MREIRYADAGMDMKKLLLCFLRRIWLPVLAAAAGAALGAAVYGVLRVVPEAEREYQAMSKIYLDFAADETGEVYQAYNGYTWNDLMATDPILEGTMRYLPEDYTREEVMEATQAQILSDLRLLTVTVTAHDADRCSRILKAAGQSLEDRGREAKEFLKIEVIRTTEAQLVVADSRMMQAVLLGLVAAMLLTLIGMMFCYVLDDRILVASDLKQVTDAPFIGYAGAGERFDADLEAGLAYLRQQKGKIAILVVDQAGSAPAPDWQELCAADGVVLEVPYARVHAVYLQYVTEQLGVRECPLAGIVISGADAGFLAGYYGGVRRSGNGAKGAAADLGGR